MWYNNSDESLDYNKPIIAISKVGIEKYILLPQIEKSSYEIIGYNWFDIRVGEYASCACFKTVSDAVVMYSDIFDIKNIPSIEVEDNNKYCNPV